MNKTLLTVALSSAVINAYAIPYEDQMVVTATRMAQPETKTLANVSVITYQDILDLQPHNTLDLFKQIPGISMVQSGGRNQTASIFIRGSNNSHALVLIDGVRVGSSTLGETQINQIPLAMIERIEVVKSPASSAYGSDAMGGIIQIFTKKPGQERNQTLSLTVGEQNTLDGNYSTSGPITNNASYSITIGYESTDGFDSRQDFDSFGTLYSQPDKDGSSEGFAKISVTQRYSDQFSSSFSFMKQKGDLEFDGSYDLESENEARYTTASLTYQSGIIENTTLVNINTDKSTSTLFTFPTPDETFKTEKSTVSNLTSIQANEQLSLTIGLERIEENVGKSTLTYDKDNRVTNAAFLQSIFSPMEALSIQTGLRTDHNSQYDSEETYNLGFAIFVDQFTFGLHQSSGFKAPTFNDLYWPGSGNPNLNPEESKSTEASISANFDKLDVSLAVYNNQFTNLIEWADIGNGIYKPSNVESATIQGSELNFQFKVLDINNQLTFEYKNPKNDKTDLYLISQTKESAKWTSQYTNGKLGAGVSMAYESKRFDDKFNQTILSPYTVWSARASYQFSAKFRGDASVDNIFDKEYETRYSYNSQPRTFYLTVNYQL